MSDRTSFRTLIPGAAPALGAGLTLLLVACGDNAPSAPDLPDPGEPELSEAAPEDSAPQIDIADARFPQEYSDISVDPAVRYGELENGFRYAILENDTPSGTAALRLRFDIGALMEGEDQRGLAHFLEHMAFNGSENVPEGEMIKILERHGLAFGADTNAYTSFGETVYMLDLPETDDETLDVSFMLMDELSALTIAQDAVDRERGVVLSEMRTRNSPSYRAAVEQYAYLLDGTLVPQRMPIGVQDVLQNAPAERLRDLYERYYTPERAFFVAVGDFDPDDIEQRIMEAFADWEEPANAGADPDVGAVTAEGPAAEFFHDPSLPMMIDINYVAPAENLPDMQETRRENLLQTLSMAMLNRRFDALSRAPDAKFLQAGANAGEMEDVADIASVTIYSEPQNWQAAMIVAENELRRAIAYGFSDAELAEQMANLRASQENAAAQADTRQTPGLASGVVGAFGGDQVFSHPVDSLARFNAYTEGLTVEEVNEAFREAWEGGEPLIWVTSPEDIEDAEATILAAYEDAAAMEVEAPEDTAAGEFAYQDFGEPGEVAERDVVEDLGIVRIRFDNNVMLNFKQTDFETGAVRAAIRFGGGLLETPEDGAALQMVASSILGPGGTGEHSLDELDRLLAGKTVSAGFGAGEDAFSSGARTIPQDLETQLQVWAAYLSDAAFRPESISQFRQRYAIVYPTMSATPGSVAQRDVQQILAGGDPRFGYPTLEAVQAVELDEARALLQDTLSNSAVEVAIVGDVTEEQAVAAVARTLGALPERAAAPEEFADVRSVSFPSPAPDLVTLRHDGEADQAAAMVYWPTPDAEDVVLARKLTLLREVLQIRLIEKVREELGTTYSPRVGSQFSRTFPGYGYIGVSMEIDTSKVDETFEVVDEIAADFAAGNISEDEFERARRPLLEGIEENQEQNGYWAQLLAQAQTEPDNLERHRTQMADYEAVTLDDIKALAQEYLTPEAALRIQILPQDAEGAEL